MQRSSRKKKVEMTHDPLGNELYQLSQTRGHKSPGEIVGDLLPRAFIPPALVSLFLSIPLGLTLSGLELLSVPTPNAIVVAWFWLMGFSPLFYAKRVDLALVPALLLNAALQIYQVALFPDFSIYPLMIAPSLIASVCLILVCLANGKHPPLRFFWVWLALNIPALFGGIGSDLLSTEDSLFLFILNIALPFAMACGATAMIGRAATTDQLRVVLSVAVLSTGIVPLLLVPLELYHRDTISLLALQFSRSYSVLGLLILMWPVWLQLLLSLPSLPRMLIFCGVCAAFLVSFSRGAGTLFILMILISIVSRRGMGSTVVRAVAFVGVLAALLLMFGFESGIGEFVWAWLLRLNIASNTSNYFDVDVSQLLLSDRPELWEMGLAWVRESPWFGHGFGAVPELFLAHTRGAMGFSGTHNLFMTVAVERGIFGLVSVILLFSRLAFLILAHESGARTAKFLSGISFFVFLVFANVTGVELYILSNRTFNFDITVYLFLLLCLFELEAGSRRAASLKVQN